MLKSIIRWIKEGNDCEKCPAGWEDITDNESGREYDCGCYIKGSDYDETICRLPKFVRRILCRRQKYLRNHEYDDMGDWYNKSEEKDNCIQAALGKELEHKFICFKSDDGIFYECDKEMIIGDLAWRARSAYDDLIREPRKTLGMEWAELIKKTVMIPFDYVKSFILK